MEEIVQVLRGEKMGKQREGTEREEEYILPLPAICVYEIAYFLVDYLL